MAFYVDPPSGWKWGFPKEIPKQVLDDNKVKDWMIENGYPKEEADEWGDQFVYRVWEIPLVGVRFLLEDGKTEMIVVKKHHTFPYVWICYPVKKLPPPYKEKYFQEVIEDYIVEHSLK